MLPTIWNVLSLRDTLLHGGKGAQLQTLLRALHMLQKILSLKIKRTFLALHVGQFC